MLPISPALLSDARILAAYLIFAGSYVVFALGKFRWMKIDRPGAAIIGAVLMVAFRIVGAREALASIDLATIVLLFSMMLAVAEFVATFSRRGTPPGNNKRAGGQEARTEHSAGRPCGAGPTGAAGSDRETNQAMSDSVGLQFDCPCAPLRPPNVQCLRS